MPEIAGMKPREAEEELLEKLSRINNFLGKLEGSYILDEKMNFGAGSTDLFFPAGKYDVEAVEFKGIYGIRPQIILNQEGKEHRIKASKFLRIIGESDKREELLEIYEEFKDLKNKIAEDTGNLKPKKVEKLKGKTKKRFWSIFFPKSKK